MKLFFASLILFFAEVCSAGPGRGLDNTDFNQMIDHSISESKELAETYQDRIKLKKIDPKVQPNYRPTKEDLGIAEPEEVFSPTADAYTAQEDVGRYHSDKKDTERISAELEN